MNTANIRSNKEDKRDLLQESLHAAILLEVIPLEAGLLCVAVLSKNILLFLLIKLICLTFILFPLCKHLRADRQKTFAILKSRISIIIAIVAANLAANAVMLYRIFFS